MIDWYINIHVLLHKCFEHFYENDNRFLLGSINSSLHYWFINLIGSIIIIVVIIIIIIIVGWNMDSDYFCKYRIISWLESDLYFDPETQFFLFH